MLTREEVHLLVWPYSEWVTHERMERIEKSHLEALDKLDEIKETVRWYLECQAAKRVVKMFTRGIFFPRITEDGWKEMEKTIEAAEAELRRLVEK